ncbi:MAG TPA: CoA pyrophosphatase [Candidatus Limnocylindria bacterium]|nr:CoA pyrophosphatase [Candidatus Limnocylindria bacterium]
MDRILRAEGGWQDAVASALRSVPRPIATDPRLLPRAVATVDGVQPRAVPSAAGAPRDAATLLLLYPGPDGELHVPLTLRRPDLRSHAGEVSLPGGAVDAGDESALAAALREAWEEIGVAPDAVRPLGALDQIWIPVSGFQLRPFVGGVESRPALMPHADEVAGIVELPLRLLVADDAVVERLIEGPGWSLRAGAYLHGELVIWGATARTLAMFATVMRHALSAGS